MSNTKILAERVGFSAEAFGKLSYAAKFAHLSQEDLATSLGQMSKRLGEVAMTGEGPAANALKRFGLTAQQLVAMGPEKAFGVLLDVMQKIPNPMERSAIAMELFGRSGQGMINLIAQGGPEIKALGEEAARMGLALNAVDSAKIVEAEESMIKLSAATTGFANLLVTQLAPYLTLAIDKYVEWGYSGAKSASFITQGTDWITQALGYVVDGVNIVKSAFYAWRSLTTAVIGSIVGGLGFLIDKLDAMLVSFGMAKTGAAEFFTAWKEGLDAASKADVDAGMKAFDAIGKGHQTVRKLVDDIQGAANERAKEKAKKAADFIAPGGVAGKPETQKFPGADERGSTQAYSAILASRGMQVSTEQQQIAHNTKIGADAAVQNVAVLKAINDNLLKQGHNVGGGLNKI